MACSGTVIMPNKLTQLYKVVTSERDILRADVPPATVIDASHIKPRRT